MLGLSWEPLVLGKIKWLGPGLVDSALTLRISADLGRRKRGGWGDASPAVEKLAGGRPGLEK